VIIVIGCCAVNAELGTHWIIRATPGKSRGQRDVQDAERQSLKQGDAITFDVLVVAIGVLNVLRDLITSVTVMGI
jgi:ASC-1-like (ASCH) protein